MDVGFHALKKPMSLKGPFIMAANPAERVQALTGVDVSAAAETDLVKFEQWVERVGGNPQFPFDVWERSLTLGVAFRLIGDDADVEDYFPLLHRLSSQLEDKVLTYLTNMIHETHKSKDHPLKIGWNGVAYLLYNGLMSAGIAATTRAALLQFFIDMADILAEKHTNTGYPLHGDYMYDNLFKSLPRAERMQLAQGIQARVAQTDHVPAGMPMDARTVLLAHCLANR